jgi:hypothetical protein
MTTTLAYEHPAYAENKESATNGNEPVCLENAENAKAQGLMEARKRMQKRVGDITGSITEILSQKGEPGLQEFFETCNRWNEEDFYVFFVGKYHITPRYAKYKMNVHPNPDLVGMFAKKNVIAMSYIPKEDFFEEDCEQATTEGKWFGPYRNTKETEQEGIYSISRKSMYYKKAPNTDLIVAGVVVEVSRVSDSQIERPNRFIANSSKGLQTENHSVERMARMRLKKWKQARRTFAD